jgi:hypothetical protein
MAKLSGLEWRKDRIAWATTDEEADASPAWDAEMTCKGCSHVQFVAAVVDQRADTIAPTGAPGRCCDRPRLDVSAYRKVTVPLDPRTKNQYNRTKPLQPDPT